MTIDDERRITPEHPASPPAVIADRGVGAVVASAAGDALGAGYEFGPPLADDVAVAMVGGGSFGWAPGEWTDDTQMAVCILDGLSRGDTDPAAASDAFRTWFSSGPADVGVQTSAVLRSAGSLAQAAAEYHRAHPDRSAGNGSLMRTGPIALAAPGRPDEIATLAVEFSALTHADPDCLDACALWSVAIDHSIHHAPGAEAVWSYADALRVGLDHLPADRRDRWAGLISEAEIASPREFTRNGWVVHAFQAALAAAQSTPVPRAHHAPDHLRRSLEAAVRVGGDTDTVAAIAGSLLGARWGATAVPVEWRRILHGRGAEADDAWTASRLDTAARWAANGGAPGANGWPGCDSLLGHYRSSAAPVGRDSELAGVRFGDVTTLADAVKEGADVVVSLCRMGTRDVPDHVEHHVIGIHDTESADNPNLVWVLTDLVDTVAAAVADGRRVFVHCVAAENRTPTVAAAWLRRHHGHDADEALIVAGRSLHTPREFLADAVRAIEPR